MERLPKMHIKGRSNVPVSFEKDAFERVIWAQKSSLVGVDEVGRGCLAGPLVTAAVVLPIGIKTNILVDSKVLTKGQREKAANWILRHCRYGIGIIHHRLIDKHNIYQATILGMKRALVNLMAVVPKVPGAILVDAMPLTLDDTSFSGVPVYYFTKGEQKSSSIAAASILAKVKRDTIMQRLGTVFPGYYLAQHKGYSTKKHKECLLQARESVIHRKTFLKGIERGVVSVQQSFC